MYKAKLNINCTIVEIIQLYSLISNFNLIRNTFTNVLFSFNK